MRWQELACVLLRFRDVNSCRFFTAQCAVDITILGDTMSQTEKTRRDWLLLVPLLLQLMLPGDTAHATVNVKFEIQDTFG